MWAIDLGTTNTGIARWDAGARRPEVIELPGVCGRPSESAPGAIDAPRMVPSAVHLVEPDLWARWRWSRRALLAGTEALIGRPALDLNASWPHPCFATSFKPLLVREPTRAIARLGPRTATARDVARVFLREILREVRNATGERVRDLVMTAPVDSYDSFRAELRTMAEEAGVRRIQFADEPVAAAVGYGLGASSQRQVLVFDMGGGTMHLALAAVTPRGMEAGRCEVLAKSGRAIGGDLVDRWVLEDVCRELGLKMENESGDETETLWRRTMLAEARRVKEAIHFHESATFTLVAPAELRGVQARLAGLPPSVEVTRSRVTSVLEDRGLYEALEEGIDRVTKEAGPRVDEVLMVGGSSLLPGIYARFESRFGRDRVRAWQPFESVVLGGAVLAGGGLVQADHIVHDYAILTYDARTNDPEYTVVIPRGTHFPTPGDFWRRQLVPTCALGEPETIFKLVVCEIGSHGEDGRRFGWDAHGNLRVLDQRDADRVVVPLNAKNPVLGRLRPAHPPSDRRPRLDISFGVNAERWLVASVRDLLARRTLMADEPVVRLL